MLSATVISDVPPAPEAAPLSFWQKYKWAIIEGAIGVAAITTAVVLYRRRSSWALGSAEQCKVFFNMNGSPYEQGTYLRNDAVARASNLKSAGYEAWVDCNS